MISKAKAKGFACGFVLMLLSLIILSSCQIPVVISPPALVKFEARVFSLGEGYAFVAEVCKIEGVSVFEGGGTDLFPEMFFQVAEKYDFINKVIALASRHEGVVWVKIDGLSIYDAR